MYSNSEIQTIHQQGKSILNKRYVTLNGIVYIGIKDGRLKLDKYGNTIADLTTTGTIAGTYGDATNVGQFTVDDKGRITNASNVLIDVGTEDLLATLTIGNTGGGLDIIDVAGLQDSFSIRSIDIENRQLISSTGLVWSLDWENRLICDSNGQYSVDWENRYLQDSALVVKLDWENFSMPTLGGSGAGFVAVDNAGLLSFGTAAPLNHDILSSTHGDTLAGAVVRGDIIVGNATPKWDKLAVGAAGTVLIGGTDPSYSSSPTISVSITSPLIIGGTAVGSSLELRSTSGVGTTDFIKFCVGNNGGTEAMRVLTSGHFLVGATIVSSANESWGFTKNQNSYSYFRVANTTAGTASIAGFFAASDAGAGGVYQMSSIYTSSGIYEADKTIFFGGPTSGGVNVGSVSATPLCFWTNNTKKVEISSVGNMSLGGVAVRGTTVGTYAFQIFDGTSPVGTLTNGISLYSSGGNVYSMGSTGLVTIPNHAGNMVINKTTGLGIKVDTATPTFGYRDIIGDISTRPAAGGGATAIPDFVAYRGNVYSYRFGTVAPENHLHEAFVVFHIPHDYVAGTDIYIHNHWSQIVADTGGGGAVPGVCKWYFDITYADGYGTAGGAGDPFVAPKTIPVTQQGSTTQYAHMIAEVIISGATDTATTFDRATFQVDGVFMVRIYRDPADAADTLNQHTFLHYSDMHYQSTNIATKDKNSPFYT